jgi:tetratricopeptide (TPR) repeat protein
VVFRRKANQNEELLISRTSKISLQLLKNDYTLNMKCLSDYSGKNGAVSSSILSGVEDSSEDAITRGLKYYDRGDFTSALKTFKEEEEELRTCLKEGAQSVKLYHDAVFHIGNCYYRLKNYEKAI